MMIRLANCRIPLSSFLSENASNVNRNLPVILWETHSAGKRSGGPATAVVPTDLLQPEMKATVQHIRTSLFHMPANFPVVIPSAKMGRNDHLVFEFLSPLH